MNQPYATIFTVLKCLKTFGIRLPKYIWGFICSDDDFEASCAAGRPFPWYNYRLRTTDTYDFRENHAFWHAETYAIINNGAEKLQEIV